MRQNCAQEAPTILGKVLERSYCITEHTSTPV